MVDVVCLCECYEGVEKWSEIMGVEWYELVRPGVVVLWCGDVRFLHVEMVLGCEDLSGGIKWVEIV